MTGNNQQSAAFLQKSNANAQKITFGIMRKSDFLQLHMKPWILRFVLGTVLLLAQSLLIHAQGLQPILLPAAQTDRGKPLMQAMLERRTIRDFKPDKLPPQLLRQPTLVQLREGQSKALGHFGSPLPLVASTSTNHRRLPSLLNKACRRNQENVSPWAWPGMLYRLQVLRWVMALRYSHT